MTRTTLTLALAAILFAGNIGIAEAQSRLSRNQIISSLTGTERAVGQFDPAALQREAERAAARGGPDADQPLSTQLSRLRQFNIEINFDLNSARIRPESYHAVGLIADALHTPYLMGQRFVVVGHTDASGPREFNLELSKKRAASVYDALTTTFNVPTSQLVAAIGLGEEQLQDPANPRAAVNRRVQIINLGE